MKYKGIIFDLDGTLVDTAVDLMNALNYALSLHNFKQASLEQTKDWIGNGIRNLIKRALPEEYREDEKLLDELYKSLNEYYLIHCIDNTVLYPEVKETLEKLNKEDIKIAITSNKVDKALQKIIDELLPDIDFAFKSGHIEGLPHKPDPVLTNMALEKMKLSPEEVLYLGDSNTDFYTAQNGKLMPFFVDYGYERPEVLDSFKEVKKLSSIKEILKEVG